jgi:hypothetical protein
MPMDGSEREIVADLISSVRTLAAHVMTLHLQLGAVRTLLARKGMISDAEVQAAFAKLNVVASAEEVLTLTSTDAVFDELLERLNRAAQSHAHLFIHPRRSASHAAPAPPATVSVPGRAAEDRGAMRLTISTPGSLASVSAPTIPRRRSLASSLRASGWGGGVWRYHSGTCNDSEKPLSKTSSVKTGSSRSPTTYSEPSLPRFRRRARPGAEFETSCMGRG